MRVYDIILKQKLKDVNCPEKCKYSWVFGDSPYMKPQDAGLPFSKRKNEVLAIHRHLHTFWRQGERLLRKQKILSTNSEKLDNSQMNDSISQENDFYSLGYLQSCSRFHDSYLARLRQSYACACFGGNLLPPNFWLKSPKQFKIANYLYDNTNRGRLLDLLRKTGLQVKHTYGVFQWDSWRLWETFAAGTVVINLDFKKYGYVLPVMPENWKHYIGIDLKNPSAFLDRLAWAIEHYAPKAIALRFLDIVKA